MLEIPYLDSSITKEMILEPIEVTSTPFPPGEIPEILRSPFFIVEECEDQYYVRHIYNSFFCLPTAESIIELDLMMPVLDTVDSEYQLKTISIECLTANFSGIDRTLAYVIGANAQSFLKMYETQLKFAELPIELRNLYQAANMSMKGYLDFNDDAVKVPSTSRAILQALGEKFW
jgi:hypothetical protein